MPRFLSNSRNLPLSPPSSTDRPRTRPRVVVMQGETGTGKTTIANQYIDPNERFDKAEGGFWDRYNPQLHKTVVMDHMTKKSINWAVFKEITGFFRTLLNVRRSHMYILQFGEDLFNYKQII